MKAYPVANNNGFLLLLGIIEREILYWQVENEIRESRMGMRTKRIFAFAWKACLPPSAYISRIYIATYCSLHVGISYYIICISYMIHMWFDDVYQYKFFFISEWSNSNWFRVFDVQQVPQLLVYIGQSIRIFSLCGYRFCFSIRVFRRAPTDDILIKI